METQDGPVSDYINTQFALTTVTFPFHLLTSGTVLMSSGI